MNIDDYFKNPEKVEIISEELNNLQQLKIYTDDLLEKNIIDINVFTLLSKLSNKNKAICNFNSVTISLKNIEKTYSKYNDLIIIFKKVIKQIYNISLTENENLDNINDEIKMNIYKSFLLDKPDLEYTEDQKDAVKLMIDNLYDYENRSCGVYGSAGTGKTTITVDFIAFLAKHKYIKRVAFTASTNKAVNIIKYKFEPYFANKTLGETFVHFLTIHRLLNYKSSFDAQGNRIFIKKKKGILEHMI